MINLKTKHYTWKRSGCQDRPKRREVDGRARAARGRGDGRGRGARGHAPQEGLHVFEGERVVKGLQRTHARHLPTLDACGGGFNINASNIRAV